MCLLGIPWQDSYSDNTCLVLVSFCRSS